MPERIGEVSGVDEGETKCRYGCEGEDVHGG
jgi:hypothetical protein